MFPTCCLVLRHFLGVQEPKDWWAGCAGFLWVTLWEGYCSVLGLPICTNGKEQGQPPCPSRSDKAVSTLVSTDSAIYWGAARQPRDESLGHILWEPLP